MYYHFDTRVEREYKNVALFLPVCNAETSSKD